MGEINLSNHIGPYTGISYDQTVTITRPANGRKQKASERTFRIAIYGAYNAMGLIGSECNGIVILDVDKMQVLTDEIGIISSGWFGPAKAQLELFNQLVAMPWEEFQVFVNAHPRTRYPI
jgi:hypothetical protein